MNKRLHSIGTPGARSRVISMASSKIAYKGFLLFVTLLSTVMFSTVARGQVNGVGQLPDLGWGSWTQEVMYGEGWATEANIKAQSDALKASGLQSHGYVFINIDSGWQSSFDQYGRPTVDPAKYPDGMAATIQYIHNNGQKASIYWIPGVQYPVYSSGDTIQGTSYPVASIAETGVPGNAFSYGTACCNFWHEKIDFTQAGAQKYVNSIVNMFASWGVDAIKLDGVTPGSDDDNLIVDNRPDVQAWSQAIAQSGRPMELTISWALDHDYLSTWQKYANARRIEDDVNCYCATETQWPDITRLFNDLVTYQNDSGPTVGWNDLDSLIVGNGVMSGLTNDERQSTMTLWAISNSPMIVGDYLTMLDSFGLQLLTNDNVIAVDQTGAPATQITGGSNPIWASPRLSNGTYNVALFNLNSSSSSTTVDLSALGISGPADVYDLWNDKDLGSFQTSYTTTLNEHASALLRVTPSSSSQIPAPPTGLTATAGSNQVTLSWTASSGTSSYNIYRGTSPGSETQVSTGITSTSFTDSGLTDGTKYYYEVTAVSSVGESGKSTEVNATPTAGFGISASTTALTLSGISAQATSVITIAPDGDSRTLTFTCSNLPAAYSCGFTPATLPLSGLSTQQTVTMTVSSASASAVTGPHLSQRAGGILLGTLIPSGFFMLLLMPTKPGRRRRLFIALIALTVTAGLTACGSSPSAPKQPTTSSYSFQVNVLVGSSIAQTISYTLTVQ